MVTRKTLGKWAASPEMILASVQYVINDTDSNQSDVERLNHKSHNKFALWIYHFLRSQKQDTAMLDKLYTIKQRFKEIDDLLSVEEIATDHEKAGQLAKERSLLQRTVSMYDELISLNDQIDDTVNMIAEDSDPAFKALAEEELSSLMERKADIEIDWK